jgi:hypothetical protein
MPTAASAYASAADFGLDATRTGLPHRRAARPRSSWGRTSASTPPALAYTVCNSHRPVARRHARVWPTPLRLEDLSATHPPGIRQRHPRLSDPVPAGGLDATRAGLHGVQLAPTRCASARPGLANPASAGGSQRHPPAGHSAAAPPPTRPRSSSGVGNLPRWILRAMASGCRRGMRCGRACPVGRGPMRRSRHRRFPCLAAVGVPSTFPVPSTPGRVTPRRGPMSHRRSDDRHCTM